MREASLLSWQQRWLMDTGKAKWTKTLLNNVVAWYNRKHGELDYHLTQILSGHGCFGNFLFRIGKRVSPSCVFCEAPNDDAEHTLFDCPRFISPRTQLNIVLDEELNKHNFQEVILQSEENWSAISKFVKKIMSAKEIHEKSREEARQMSAIDAPQDE